MYATATASSYCRPVASRSRSFRRAPRRSSPRGRASWRSRACCKAKRTNMRPSCACSRSSSYRLPSAASSATTGPTCGCWLPSASPRPWPTPPPRSSRWRTGLHPPRADAAPCARPPSSSCARKASSKHCCNDINAKHNMRERVTQIIAILLLATVTATSYWYSQSIRRVTRVPPSAASAPDFSGERLVMTQFDEQGRAKYKLFADTLVHFADNDEVELLNPRLLSLRPDRPQIEARALHAEVEDVGEEVRMNGGVVVTRAATAEAP